MKRVWRRFVNQRNVLLLSVVLFIAFFLQIREGRFTSDRGYASYDQYRLVTDNACDITTTDCSSVGEGVRLRLALKDGPSALRAFPAQLVIEGLQHDDKTDVRLAFTMKGMDMGDVKQKLAQDKQSHAWTGKLILPICSSGRSDWTVQVEVIARNKIYLAEYQFSLVK